jgi:general secretion pathway protein D
VTLKIELQIRALGTQTENGMPIISNREYSGTISLKNNESAVVAGLISKSDSRTLTGYPFLARVPITNYLTNEHDKNVSNDELLVVMTPHVLRAPSGDILAVQMPVGH